MARQTGIVRFRLTVTSVGVLRGVLNRLSDDLGTVYMPVSVDYSKSFSFEVGGEKTLTLCKAMLGRRIKSVHLVD